MKILICAATYQEIEPFIKHYTSNFNADEEIKIDSHELKILITGVGMVATSYALGLALNKAQFDLAINVGVAGSFYKNLKIGQLVEVREDILAELGTEDDEEFLSLAAMNLGEVEFFATKNTALTDDLRKVTGITVNTVHGNTESIEAVQERLNPTIESMEGAAFFYACEEAQIPAIQIRAVSNYVEKRNRENWNIPLAVKNLNNWLIANIKKF